MTKEEKANNTSQVLGALRELKSVANDVYFMLFQMDLEDIDDLTERGDPLLDIISAIRMAEDKYMSILISMMYEKKEAGDETVCTGDGVRAEPGADV